MPLLPRNRLHRSTGARLREYDLDGLPYVILENEVFRLGFLAGKGADLVEWMVKPLDVDLAWIAPGGIVNPARAARLAPDPAAAFMDSYPGGWQTVFPHGSIPATVNGAPYGLHGEAALLPWDASIVEDSPEAVEILFRVRLQRIAFSLERRVRLESGRAAFTFAETAINESGAPCEVNWGQHITFGPPFFGPGCRILAPGGLLMHQHPIADGEPRRARFDGPLAWPVVPHAGADAPAVAISPASPEVDPAPDAAADTPGPLAGPAGPFASRGRLGGPLASVARGPRGPFDPVDRTPGPAAAGSHKPANANDPANDPANPLASSLPDPISSIHAEADTDAAPAGIDLSLTPDPGSPGEMLYLTGFGPEAWIAAENPGLGLTARIAWDGALFPWCWVWQEFGASAQWPWHARAYVVGLEPFAGPPPNANLGPAPGREPLAFAPGEAKTLILVASASQHE